MLITQRTRHSLCESQWITKELVLFLHWRWTGTGHAHVQASESVMRSRDPGVELDLLQPVAALFMVIWMHVGLIAVWVDLLLCSPHVLLICTQTEPDPNPAAESQVQTLHMKKLLAPCLRILHHVWKSAHYPIHWIFKSLCHQVVM